MKLYIKYMVSIRCKMVVKQELEKLGVPDYRVDLGQVEIRGAFSAEQRAELKQALLKSGLELMDDQRAILIEKIRNVIINMVHHEDEAPRVTNSVYISEKLDYDYTYLSNLFSATTGITIEHFVIAHKIERVKELLLYDELNLTEIAYKLNYSSVAHLSGQFKKVTGLTPTYYKNLKDKKRKTLDKIGH